MSADAVTSTFLQVFRKEVAVAQEKVIPFPLANSQEGVTSSSKEQSTK